jgi:hypothetical protein
MSPTQITLYSILESIALEYDTYVELQRDPKFRAWMKHVQSKRLATAYLKGKYDERCREKQSHKEVIPKYF